MKVDPIRHALNVGRFQFPVDASQATTLAAANSELNRAALERVWPRTVLALPESLPELEWLYARDGSLSARHVDGQWIGDVSVPRKAAERMLSRLILTGTTGVLLAPTHAAQVRVALDRLTAQQTLIVVVPTELTAGAIVACDDFSADIAAGRLWLACGPEWPVELKAIFEAHEGIAPASMMIRVPGLNAPIVDAIQKPCEELLAHHAQTQRQLVSMLAGKPRSPATPPAKVLVATGAFSLWNDGAARLGEMARSIGDRAVSIDTSLPLNASTLRFARLAESCDVIVTANLGRADVPALVADNVPWITWVTGRHLPAFPAKAASDRLVVAEAALREQAIAGGWPDGRVSVAGEPSIPAISNTNAVVTVLADCPTISIPRAIDEMSSHRLVWELAERELTRDPLAIRSSPAEFVNACADRVGVPRESLPVAILCETLVAPLFIRELVQTLRKQSAPIAVYGRGWDAIDEVADAWRGPIESMDGFRSALADAAALLDVWPLATTHAARRASRPTIRTWGKPLPALLGEIKAARLVTRTNASTTPAFALDTLF